MKKKLIFCLVMLLILTGTINFKTQKAYAFSQNITYIKNIFINRTDGTIDIFTTGDKPFYKKYLFQNGYKKYFILVFGHAVLYGRGNKLKNPFPNVFSVSYSQFSTAPKYSVHLVLRQNSLNKPDVKTVAAGNSKYETVVYASKAEAYFAKKTSAFKNRRNNVSVKGANFKVFIDAGHGGGDPGGIGPMGLPESFVNLSIALKLRKLLEAKGIKTEIDRTSNVFVSLQQRAALANQSGANLFIGLYCNSQVVPYLYGTTTYYFHRNSYQFAKYLEHYVSSKLNLKYDGILRDDLYVLRFTTMPAVVIEYAYISNPYEEHLLASSTFRQMIADAIANAIYKYFITDKR
ncbi:MAG: N-acetylmuramoyl-L-alanine amidase [Deltaproteobacteria bacterium]|nr:N-acetylmuramoyl-L-alanine amidase [Deltaproteobacteria bacterium]